jgi:hypothetical protein
MRAIFVRLSLLVLLSPIGAFAASNSVVNLSHYDLMRVDFELMQRQGIVGVIHEASYPPFVRDAKYAGAKRGDAGRFALGRVSLRERQQSGPAGGSFPDVVETSGVVRTRAAGRMRFAGARFREERALSRRARCGWIKRCNSSSAFASARGNTGPLLERESRRDVLNSRASPPSRGRCCGVLALGANYGAVPRSMSPWPRWHMWQYTGDGTCRLQPRSAYPKGIANINTPSAHFYNGSASGAISFWRQNGWRPGN